MKYRLHVSGTRLELNGAVAEDIARLAQMSISERGAFHLALAGGTTPRDVYACLAEPPLSASIPWEKVHVYFGDERTVPPDHDQSNFRMAKGALLSKVSIPAAQVHRIEGEASDPSAAAQKYERELRSAAPQSAGWPCLDLVLLGVGGDGHIASLFPDTAALQVEDRAVTAVHVPRLNTWRITLTFPVINSARHVFIVAAGAEKARIVEQILDIKPVRRYPAQDVQPASPVEWFLDSDAASRLR